ncbi:hypothetical protein B0H66DRAFT_394690 [Apodospora peruviana]|uniref:Zn(2)-C6 fungal-type domain-containing protein n=1 Tax=Apodospora peruviana TaxID=516989 RepID=A0AAE0HSP0_9PEZI|nr:hypothetical protein B0H66DRAFT_394690 [Apodospora peruviana]
MDPSSAASPLKRRACVACTTAKAKCSPHHTSHTICERCHRLGKQCVFLDLPERRRRPQSARVAFPTGRVSQVKALEDKLDALSAEIAALKQQNNGSGSVFTPQSGVSITPESNLDSSPRHPPDHGRSDIIDRSWITMSEAEHLIAIFKANFIPRFPFVTLSPNETASYLRKHSPFLFLCVVAVPLYTNPPLQHKIGEEIRRQLSLRLLFNAERSMDLLRGLLVHSAWYQYFAHQGHGQLFMLSQLCVTLAYDLGLPEGYLEKARSDDNGKRAVLGVFWLSVTTSRILQKPVGMKHTRSLDDWSLGFAVGPEDASDTAIQPMIMLQAFAFRFIEAFPNSFLKEEEQQSEVPLHATYPFLLELENIKDKIRKDGVSSEIVNYIELEILHLEIWVSQVAFVPQQKQQITFTVVPGAVPDETQFLWQKIRKIQESLERLLQMPADEMYCMPLLLQLWLCGSLTWLGRALGRLLRAIMANGTAAPDEAWKISEAQRVVDEVRYLTSADAISQKFEATYGSLLKNNEVDGSSELGRLLHHIRMIKRSYYFHVQRITGKSLVERNVLDETGQEVWGGGDSELSAMNFGDLGGGEDFDVGMWTSINDFLFFDDGFRGEQLYE